MPKEQGVPQMVVDCMHGYIPRIHEAALKKGGVVREPGKSGKEKVEGRLRYPRLKHRPDGRKYVDAKGWSGGQPGEGYVTDPRFVNPGKSSILKLSIELFWQSFENEQLEGIVGRFNTEPIQHYAGLEKYIGKEACPLFDECPHSGVSCDCIWRPFQILTWGRDDGGFVALPEDEIIRSPWISLYELRDRVKAALPYPVWVNFRNKISGKYKESYEAIPKGATEAEKIEIIEEIAAYKLMDNITRMQRTKFSIANCFGLAMHQFGLAFDTLYNDDLVVSVCLALNERDPIYETLKAAKMRLAGKGKKEKVVEKDFQDEQLVDSDVFEVFEDEFEEGVEIS